MKKFAPILIPTLNRYDHFKSCISSLKKCLYSDQTDLFIALDYPSKEEQNDGYFKIINFLNSNISGFNTVTIYKRNVNYGAFKNVMDAQNQIFQDYKSIIISEDDNEFSPNFIDYMNTGLIKFEHDPRIYSICGYKHPIIIPRDYKENYFIYKGFSAWGFAVWKDKFKTSFYSKNELVEFLSLKSNISELNKISNRHYFNIIEAIIKNKSRFGDFTYFLTNTKYNTYSIFPTISKVKNNGNDGSGVNCVEKTNDKSFDQILDEDKTFKISTNNYLESPEITNRYREYFTPKWKTRIKNYSYYLIYKFYYKYFI